VLSDLVGEQPRASLEAQVRLAGVEPEEHPDGSMVQRPIYGSGNASRSTAPGPRPRYASDQDRIRGSGVTARPPTRNRPIA
jgi:hypothetical protein